MEHQPLESFLEETVSEMKHPRVASAFGIFMRRVCRELSCDDHRYARISANEVLAGLQRLVDQGRLIVLYPAGVTQQTAPMVDTYYMPPCESAA